jgi:DNA repair protein RadC
MAVWPYNNLGTIGEQTVRIIGRMPVSNGNECILDQPERSVSPGCAEELDILMLLSAILGLGRTSVASMASARRLLHYFSTASALTNASREEIRRNAHVSPRQASVLFTALELGRKICSYPLKAGQHFSNSRDLFERYKARFFSANKEYFLSLHLNAKNQLIREVLVSIGSLSTSVVHPREVYAPAVRDSTAALIFLHNHPSGDPEPSREDRDCTRRLFSAGKILGIRVLDHIVFGHNDYFSFADAGLLRGSE